MPEWPDLDRPLGVHLSPEPGMAARLNLSPEPEGAGSLGLNLPTPTTPQDIASPAKRGAFGADITNRDMWRSPVINLADLESPQTASRGAAPLVMHKRGGGVYGSPLTRSASVDVFSPRQ